MRRAPLSGRHHVGKPVSTPRRYRRSMPQETSPQETSRHEPVDVSALYRLDGSIAIVTGASSGMGNRFARVLHGAGATVVLAARRLDRLEATVAELGERAVAVRCDVGDEADRIALIDGVLERFGAIDVLVNNAGIGRPIAPELQPISDFRDVLEVNVVGLFHLAQLAGRHMLERRRGSIVNVASTVGLVGASPFTDPGYVASKGAVVSLTRELALEWATRGVRVNALAPGWFTTEMTAEVWRHEKATGYVRRNTPMGREGDVRELDAALLLLAGPGGSFITGQIVTVDGGWTAR
jgi:NAD(P)-dependent dehydrogenase (short-subunit alcohol dehydrogenase family)